jgi:hypothetical protein
MTDALFGKLPAWEDQFLAFWAQGIFRKLGKTEARRRLRATVKTDADWRALYEAHEAYKADLKRFPRALLHGSTFASQWKDFLDIALSAEEMNRDADHFHLCRMCDEDHRWRCNVSHCDWSLDIACPEFIERRRAAKA